MRFDYIEPDQYLVAILDQASAGKRGYCCVTNVHSCMLSYDDPEFKMIIDAANFAISDSKILQKSFCFRYDLPSIATLKGADIMLHLCQSAEQRNLPIALIGGKDDAILLMLERELLSKFPKLQIVYKYSPPFAGVSNREEQETIDRLRFSKAKLVFVGLGCPKQEHWMAKYTPQLSSMQIGVGAAFDFNAGVIKPSPDWVHQNGLEWLYRLISEPRRLWRRYLSTSPRFVFLLLRDKYFPF